MFEQVSRVLGLDGVAVTAVLERADELEVEVELAVPAKLLPPVRRDRAGGEGAAARACARLAAGGAAGDARLAQAPLSLPPLSAQLQRVACRSARAAAGEQALPRPALPATARRRRAIGGCARGADEPLPGRACLPGRRRAGARRAPATARASALYRRGRTSSRLEAAGDRRLPPPPLARTPAPAQRQGTTHRATTPLALRALPARAAARRGLGTEGTLPRDLPLPQPRAGRAAARALPQRNRTRTDPILSRLRQRPARLARRAARLLRPTQHERLRRRSDQQNQSDQTPRLRTPKLRQLPHTHPHSMRLTGSRNSTPLHQQEPESVTTSTSAAADVSADRASECPNPG